MEFGKTEFF